MNHLPLKTRLIYPEVSTEDLSFALKYSRLPSIAFLLLGFVLVWRAQIANSQTKESISKKDLQGSPSMKLTAKIIATVPVIRDFICSIAVSQSAFFDQKEYTALPAERRSSFIRSRIDEIIEPGKAKILSPRQISNLEDLNTHRRGLTAKICGLLQATSLFTPNSILKGANIAFLTFDQFIDVISESLKSLGIDHPLLKIHDEAIRDYEADISELDLRETCIILIKDYFVEIVDTDNLIFEDGIIVSKDSSNTVPMEEIFGVTRNKPMLLIESPIEESDDLFIKSALKQQGEIKKADKSLFSNKPKGKKFGK